MKVVPEDVLTCPLGTVRGPQSTAVEYKHSGYSVHSRSCYILTCTSGGLWSPQCSGPTSPSVRSNNVVSSVTGVGSSHHEGGSRGCVHYSIGGGGEAIAVNSWEVDRN